MILQTLTLRQFRSYSELTLNVEPGVNLFLGYNGVGKTNLLEAISVLTTGLSPRAHDTDSLIQWGQSGFFIKGVFGFESTYQSPMSLEMKFQVGCPRVIRQNGQEVVRLKNLLGRVPLVSFVPEDLAMIKGEPALRRRAMNMILMQVDPAYAAALKTYQEALRARNAALKQCAEGRLSAADLNPWDASLIQAGLVVCAKRAAFVKDFSERCGSVHERVSGGDEFLEILYKPSFAGPWAEPDVDRWTDKIQSLRSQELALGMTLVGPHRDELMFQLNSRPARSFASEGQTRTAALAFKLAEIPYILEKTGQKPICLLDDVLSELDAKRAVHLLDELTQTGQCFVTLTGLEAWPQNQKRPTAIYRVDSQGVFPEKAEPLTLLA